MLQQQRCLDLSPYSEIFDLVVPKDNFWRQLSEASDFSDAISSISRNYSLNRGCIAIDPGIMLRLLIIKEYYEWSDNDTIEETRVNLALRLFVGVPLDEDMPDKTTLSYFRRMRLKDADVASRLLESSVAAAVKAGILKVDDMGRKILRVAIDATHSEAYAPRLFADDILSRRCRQLIRAVVQSQLIDWDETIEVPSKMNSSEAIDFAQSLLDSLKEAYPEYESIPAIARIASRMAEELEDLRDHAYTSTVDKDARVGHKSSTHKFFGYKSHIVADAGSGIALDFSKTPGNVSDTTEGEKLLTDLCGDPSNKVEQLLGDGSYSSSDIIGLSEKYDFELIATPNASLGSCKAFDHGFTYVKDADAMQCPAGELSCSKRIVIDKRYDHKTAIFSFSKNKCSRCPLRHKCYVAQKNQRSAEMPLLTEGQEHLLAIQTTEDFKEKYKARSAIERLNGDIKQNRSMRRAQAPGLQNMTLQCAISLYTYNMRKILRALSDKKSENCQ